MTSGTSTKSSPKKHRPQSATTGKLSSPSPLPGSKTVATIVTATPPSSRSPSSSSKSSSLKQTTTKTAKKTKTKKKIVTSRNDDINGSDADGIPKRAALPTTQPSRTEEQPQTKETVRQTTSQNLIFGVIGCCLIIMLIIALVVGLVVVKNGNDQDADAANNSPQQELGMPNPSPGSRPPASPGTPFSYPTLPPIPSPFPTRAPQAPQFVGPTPTTTPRPTLRPTVPPAPISEPTSLLQPSASQIIVLPYADTYVFRDGLTPFEAFGTEDTFLVQDGGPAELKDFAEAVGLMAFDLSQLPTSGIQSMTLRLYHLPGTRDGGAATLTIRRLASTPLEIEYLHASLFDPAEDEGVEGPSFVVNPDDTIIDVDIMDLAQGQEDLFVMLENKGTELGDGTDGDYFFSRETGDPPQLIITLA